MSQQEQEERPPAKPAEEQEGGDKQSKASRPSSLSIFEQVKQRRAKRRVTLQSNEPAGREEYSARMARIAVELDELKVLYNIKREVDALLEKRKAALRSEQILS